jgi:hypothetical protein
VQHASQCGNRRFGRNSRLCNDLAQLGSSGSADKAGAMACGRYTRGLVRRRNSGNTDG